jgi:signal transduction histidine kinase
VLQREGYEVVALSTASAALSAVDRQPFDVIVADLSLETADSGLSLLAEARKRSPHTRAVVLTGHGTLDSAIQALRLGVSNYLLKPCNVEELKLSVALALERAAREQAEEAVRTRNEFIMAAVHDLKNPLAAVRGWATLLERRAREGEPAVAATLVDGLSQLQLVSRRMESLVEELLELAQLDIGQSLALNQEPADLVGLARRAVGEYQRTTERHQLQLVASEPEITGDWDGLRIERVVGNLLGNAIKYSPQGGDITVTVSRLGQEASIAVHDQGMGIPADDLPHVFERFRRGQNVPADAGGRGIGLEYARRLVEATAAACRFRAKRAGAAPSPSCCRSTSAAKRRQRLPPRSLIGVPQ